MSTVLMETRQVKGALKAMLIKTDRRDAEGIAQLLQMGWYRPGHCRRAHPVGSDQNGSTAIELLGVRRDVVRPQRHSAGPAPLP